VPLTKLLRSSYHCATTQSTPDLINMSRTKPASRGACGALTVRPLIREQTSRRHARRPYGPDESRLARPGQKQHSH
jgi:hypothetical protein